MPLPLNPKPIDAAEHDAIVARLRATSGDVATVAAQFNRGFTTVSRLLPRADLCRK